MDELDLYKNNAEKKTNEYIELFKEPNSPNKGINWDQRYRTMGDNLLRDLEVIRNNYLKRPDSIHTTITDEDFYGSLVYKFRDECAKHIDAVGG